MNAEQLHRLKTQTNRKLLNRVKQSGKPHLWAERFETAKGEVSHPMAKVSGAGHEKTSSSHVVQGGTVAVGPKHPFDTALQRHYKSLLGLVERKEGELTTETSEGDLSRQGASSFEEVLKREIGGTKTSSPWEVAPSYETQQSRERREFHQQRFEAHVASPAALASESERELAYSRQKLAEAGFATAHEYHHAARQALQRAEAEETAAALKYSSALHAVAATSAEVVQEVGLTPGEALAVVHHVLREAPAAAQEDIFGKTAAAVFLHFGIDPAAAVAAEGAHPLAVKTSQAMLHVRMEIEEVNERSPQVRSVREALQAHEERTKMSMAVQVLRERVSAYDQAVRGLR